jgi:hypothetical protein
MRTRKVRGGGVFSRLATNASTTIATLLQKAKSFGSSLPSKVDGLDEVLHHGVPFASVHSMIASQLIGILKMKKKLSPEKIKSVKATVAVFSRFLKSVHVSVKDEGNHERLLNLMDRISLTDGETMKSTEQVIAATMETISNTAPHSGGGEGFIKDYLSGRPLLKSILYISFLCILVHVPANALPACAAGIFTGLMASGGIISLPLCLLSAAVAGGVGLIKCMKCVLKNLWSESEGTERSEYYLIEGCTNPWN